MSTPVAITTAALTRANLNHRSAVILLIPFLTFKDGPFVIFTSDHRQQRPHGVGVAGGDLGGVKHLTQRSDSPMAAVTTGWRKLRGAG